LRVFLSLLLQIVTLLPSAQDEVVAPEPAYLNSVQALAASAAWPADSMAALTPDSSAQMAALAWLIEDGTDPEVRLAAVLSAGAESDSPLGYSLWRRAALDFNEERSLACLLAPNTPDTTALPLLAWIASDKSRSLPVRAAAVARLLDADCLAAWSICRLMLLTGTAADRTTTIADWPRKGRYELPKRILLLSLQHFLQRQGQPITDFEPNAAWNTQVLQVAELDELISNSCTPLVGPAQTPPSWHALMKLKEAGSDHAAASFELFRNRASAMLTE